MSLNLSVTVYIVKKIIESLIKTQEKSIFVLKLSKFITTAYLQFKHIKLKWLFFY